MIGQRLSVSGVLLFGLYRNQWKIILTLFWVAGTFAYAP
jgi:hypothetical protein